MKFHRRDAVSVKSQIAVRTRARSTTLPLVTLVTLVLASRAHDAPTLDSSSSERILCSMAASDTAT